jgi:hypothetical protein
MNDVYTIDGFDDLYETADELPEVEKRGTILAANDRTEETEPLGYRTPLISENESVVGDVSRGYYEVSQFGDIIEALGHAAEQYDDQLDVTGHVMISDDDRKMTSYIGFDDLVAEPIDGDQIALGVKTRAGHTGMHGIRYDVGAERMICSNGMIAFDSEKEFSRTHNEPLDYALAQHAVDSVVNGVEEIEDRIDRANQREFYNWDEAVITLRDLGVGDEFDEPVSVLTAALDEETEGSREAPTLWEAYNAATRAYTHSDDLNSEQRDRGLERAARLLDDYGEVPEADQLGHSAVMRRSEALNDADAEEYWEDEREAVSELLEVHGETA